MKKFLALLLALTMVFALAACGATPAPSTTPEKETETPAETTGDAPSYTIKFATGSTADLENPQNVGTYKFEELVEEHKIFLRAFCLELGSLLHLQAKKLT